MNFFRQAPGRASRGPREKVGEIMARLAVVVKRFAGVFDLLRPQFSVAEDICSSSSILSSLACVFEKGSRLKRQKTYIRVRSRLYLLAPV
jgi:hypothetical protein